MRARWLRLANHLWQMRRAHPAPTTAVCSISVGRSALARRKNFNDHAAGDVSRHDRSPERTVEAYKQQFIEFMVRCEVLTFGDFVTKSGRHTPFFVNTGRYRTGAQIAELGGYYADAISRTIPEGIDVLFGPAYKGIPLSVATAMALDSRGSPVGFCFNRKEVKDHGEKGSLIGHPLADGTRVLIIEDVTTAGTSVRETVPLLRSAGNVQLSGLVVSVDRMERGTGEQNALAELRDAFRMKTFAIVTIEEVMEYLRGREVDGRVVLTEALFDKMRAYREKYGGTE
jgi:orotate phosphoribosyltransferase